ncbi:helix-turn-helix domain-containing protein [Candidatus Tisiphia endosymbiont of Beris chalybata]|uniref:helix-turn-helix domain-containing protein n=1 Tax=Candidatus Tisiphia endosymbiont of Beris chalybata TaxID=3066262 RepID=UPI00312C72DD
MSKPYPYELRIRAIKLIEAGMSVSKVKELLNISRQTLHKWQNIKKEGGDITPKKGYQKGHNNKIKDMEEFKEFIDNNQDKSLKELARIFGKCGATTIWHGIQKLGYSYKKNFYSS